MLYVTTRNDRDTFPAQHVRCQSRGSDGGLFLPFRNPRFSAEDLMSLSEKNFHERIAEILNLLFQTKLTQWDVEFAVGSEPVKLVPLGHRVIMAQCWHNSAGDYLQLEKSLAKRLQCDGKVPGNWTAIAVRIALITALFCELQRQGIDLADISLVSGDFSAPMAARYARKWGIPIGNIICCCNENRNIWDLIVYGQMRTDTVAVKTGIPEADITIPENMERLIYDCGGAEEVESYLLSCRKGSSYAIGETLLNKFRDGMFVSVVSSQRMERTIPGVYRTHDYLLSPTAALAYAGLQDYRAKNGVSRYTLVIEDKSPACDGAMVAQILGIKLEMLADLI